MALPRRFPALRPRPPRRSSAVGEGGLSMSDLLQVKNLKVEFQTQAGVVRAVENISLRVRAGSTEALGGESGSGKTITAPAIMGILPRTARLADGQILLADPAVGGTAVDLAKLNPDSPRFRSIRGNRISIIFQ